MTKTDWIATYTNVRKLVEIREKAVKMGKIGYADLIAARITELTGAPVARGEKAGLAEIIKEALHFEHLHKERGWFANGWPRRKQAAKTAAYSTHGITGSSMRWHAPTSAATT